MGQSMEGLKEKKVNPNVNNARLGETAWVVQTYDIEFLVASDVFTEKFREIQAEWDEIKNRPLVKALSEPELDQKMLEFINERCESENIRRRFPVQQIAFYDKCLANSVAPKIMGSLSPVEMNVSKIYVRVDEYREQALDNEIPFFIILENGQFTMEDNPFEIFEIKRPSADPNYPSVFSGTFWANSYNQAIVDAQDYYDRWIRVK